MEIPSPVREAEDKEAISVRQIHNEVASLLSGLVSDEEFISAFSGERNAGFNTAVRRKTVTEGNTVIACVHDMQTVSDGQVLRLRLVEPMFVTGCFIPKGIVLVGGTYIQGERLKITVSIVKHKRAILPVELKVHDLDGQQGILVPGSPEYDVAREIAADMGTPMNSSINISTDVGAQIASDLGKGAIQGVSQYILKWMRTVKIILKARHRVPLHLPGK